MDFDIADAHVPHQIFLFEQQIAYLRRALERSPSPPTTPQQRKRPRLLDSDFRSIQLHKNKRSLARALAMLSKLKIRAASLAVVQEEIQIFNQRDLGRKVPEMWIKQESVKYKASKDKRQNRGGSKRASSSIKARRSR